MVEWKELGGNEGMGGRNCGFTESELAGPCLLKDVIFFTFLKKWQHNVNIYITLYLYYISPGSLL